ncbi:hypothetical protein EYR38_009645 [Pleurotus pulmonarius]|nr:hypothetical protein EYR38_009645 [Pleurotus pulmonarius]
MIFVGSTTTTYYLIFLIPLFLLVIFKFRTANKGDIHRLPLVSPSISHWLFGHELLVFMHNASQMYSIWAQSLGRVYRIKAALFHHDIIIITDHQAVHHILNNADFGREPSFRQIIAHSVGRGIIWADGADHAYQKRLLSPAFTAAAVEAMGPAIFDCADELVDKLLTHINMSSGRQQSVINIRDQCSACALDIFGRIGLRHAFDALKSMPISPGHASGVTVQIDATLIILAWRDLIRTSQYLSSLVARAFIRVCPTVADLPMPGLASVSSQTIQRLTKPLLERAHVVSDSDNHNILSILARESKSLSEYQLVQNMSSLVSAGHETVAGTASFILLELARRPEAQARLRQEIVQNSRCFSYEGIQRLEYLDAVVKEGLRIHPPSQTTDRMALVDGEIPLSAPIQGQDGAPIQSLSVRMGQVFVIPFKVINTAEAIWGPDGSIFRPERWLSTGIDQGGIPPPDDLPNGWSGIMSFSAGPRQCLGIKTGVFEVKVLVATLIRSLEFRPTGQTLRTVPLPTLQPIAEGVEGSLPLFVTPVT